MKLEWTAKNIAESLDISRQNVWKRAINERWQYHKKKNSNGGGYVKVFQLSDLPVDLQMVIISKTETISEKDIVGLAPKAQIEAFKKMMVFEKSGFLSPSTIDPQLDLFEVSSPGLGEPASLPDSPRPSPPRSFLSPTMIDDSRVVNIAQIVQETLDMPQGQKRARWIQLVAIKHGISKATLYRYIQKYDRAGIAGFKHKKSNRGQARSWSPEAIDFWVGLCLKREHRKISKEALYECLQIEAQKRDWQIGGYRSALWWFDRKVTPQLLALQRGGSRALDNTLPPVCRDYSDLRPFEILVGDQHRFDFWVVDDETGQVLRPEGYFWQDLRTRCFYGGALAARYDSFLMGLALRIGLKRFGGFGSIYTDHGKPEESRYIAGILNGMKTLGLCAKETFDIPATITDGEPEQMNCRVLFPGSHKKAIVRNAKAKMIEGTFNSLERILRNKIKIPGNVKILTASQEEQEIDQKEIEKLALAGKLKTFREFTLAVYQAMDHYNSERPHRGIIREWLWHPKPKQGTPMQCLEQCYLKDGWRPRRVDENAIDIVFLPIQKNRAIDRGRITFKGERYEHDALLTLRSIERVDIRFDPLDSSWILVFHRGEYLCRAKQIEYSSMKDRDLAERKIKEKVRRRKIFLEQYKNLVFWVPDFREYSNVPAATRPPAIIGKAKTAILEEKSKEIKRFRVRDSKELAANVKQLESYKSKLRPIFTTESDRYQYLLDTIVAGEEIFLEDKAFMSEYEARMGSEMRSYWAIYKESIGSEGGKL